MGNESNGSEKHFALGRSPPLLAIPSLALICLSLAATPTQGMGMCGAREDFVKALNDKYQETRKSIGLAGEVNVVELFTSKTGTWTLLVTTQAGQSCIVAAGKGWEDLPSEIRGTDL